MRTGLHNGLAQLAAWLADLGSSLNELGRKRGFSGSARRAISTDRQASTRPVISLLWSRREIQRSR